MPIFTIMDHLYLKVWWRRTKKTFLISLLNILSYSSGFILAFILLLYVYNERSYNTSYPGHKRLYRLISENTGFESKTPGTPFTLLKVIDDEIPGVENSSRLANVGRTDILKNGSVISETGLRAVDPPFFEMFSIRFLHGADQMRHFDEPNNVIITRSAASRYFDRENAMGEIMRVKRGNREIPLTVIGVIEDLPENSTIKGSLFINLEPAFNNLMSGFADIKDDWTGFYAHTYLLLPGSSDPRQVEETIHNATRRFMTEYATFGYELQPVSEIYLNSANLINDFTIKGDKRKVEAFFTGAIFIIIINIFNYIILNISNLASRNKEIGLYKLFGALRKDFFRQFAVETVINLLLSLAIVLSLTELFYSGFNQLFSRNIVISLPEMIRFFLLFSLLLFIVNLLPGIYISSYLSKLSPVSALRSLLSSVRGKFVLRRTFILVQLSVFSILIIYTTIVNRQVSYAVNFNPGFNKEDVLIIRGTLSGRVKDNHQVFIEEAEKLPVVQYATGALAFPPHPRGGNIQMYFPPDNPERVVKLAPLITYYNFINTLELNLIAGRDFSAETDIEQYGYIVITQSAAAAMEMENPIGKTIQLGTRQCRIIGLIDDFIVNTVHSLQEPIYIMLSTNASELLDIGIRLMPGYTREDIEKIKALYKSVTGAEVVNTMFFDDQVRLYSQDEAQWSRLIKLFTMLSVFLISLGLIGLSAFILANRTKEIAIRKVFGAGYSRLLWLVYKEFIFLAAAAILISAPIAWYFSSRWLESFHRQISVGPGIFMFSSATLLLFTIICISYKGIEVINSRISVTIKHD
jgi:putative ABC transport system permease protein